MLVRWLGAFGSSSSLAESLSWELSQREREVAAERVATSRKVQEWAYDKSGQLRERLVPAGNGSIQHALVGLWIDKRAVVRSFTGDVWSVTSEDGRLVPTRHSKPCGHTEVFCRPGYVKALVVKKHPASLSGEVLSALRDASKSHDLDVFLLTARGKRVLVTKEVRGFKG